MDKDGSSFRIAPDRLARLYSIKEDKNAIEEPIDVEGEKRGLLSERLSDVIPLAAEEVEALPVLLGYLHRELLPVAGKSVGSLLLDSKTELAVILKIKEFGKKLSSSAGSEVERDVAVVIYYVAIGSGMIFHDQKITQYSWQELECSFGMLIAKSWVGDDLKNVFSQAREVCQKRSRNSENG